MNAKQFQSNMPLRPLRQRVLRVSIIVSSSPLNYHHHASWMEGIRNPFVAVDDGTTKIAASQHDGGYHHIITAQLELLVNLHNGTERQGPGGIEQTRLAITLSGLTPSSELQIADVGSGSGATSLVLAESLQAHVMAVDIVPTFLQNLASRAIPLGLVRQIQTVKCDMASLPFENGQLDAIFSEGAIYNIGFENGIKEWRRFLKPNGILAVSELTWLTDKRPQELQDYWKQEYNEVDTASNKIALLEKNGYELLGYFVLPEHCWSENYYGRLQFDKFLNQHTHSEAAIKIVEEQKKEIAFHEQYNEYYGYGYYIAKRVEA